VAQIQPSPWVRTFVLYLSHGPRHQPGWWRHPRVSWRRRARGAPLPRAIPRL